MAAVKMAGLIATNTAAVVDTFPLSQGTIMAKKEVLDPETLALIEWCIEVEGFLVAGGATVAEAQDHIEEQVEWFTDQFYDGLTPEQAAKEALA
ncbi:hypothetical protein GCM10022212_27400 [Actimicrobium antarcticum]|uniref:Uncharacterized protein n=2 Tax=Actimicrobium antarcticum TaxID=1051899 RepID=A0ABP7TKY5_9BURK